MTTGGGNQNLGNERQIPPTAFTADIGGRGLWTSAETAEWLTVPERMVRRLVAERRIPYVKVGRYVRFRPQDVKEWRDAHLHPAVAIDVERRNRLR
jgi:excisionase family DNA binding protein